MTVRESERKWCLPLLHKWGKWGELERGVRKVVYHPDTASLRTEDSFSFTFQKRECERCGLVQTRKL